MTKKVSAKPSGAMPTRLLSGIWPFMLTIGGLAVFLGYLLWLYDERLPAVVTGSRVSDSRVSTDKPSAKRDAAKGSGVAASPFDLLDCSRSPSPCGSPPDTLERQGESMSLSAMVLHFEAGRLDIVKDISAELLGCVAVRYLASTEASPEAAPKGVCYGNAPDRIDKLVTATLQTRLKNGSPEVEQAYVGWMRERMYRLEDQLDLTLKARAETGSTRVDSNAESIDALRAAYATQKESLIQYLETKLDRNEKENALLARLKGNSLNKPAA